MIFVPKRHEAQYILKSFLLSSSLICPPCNKLNISESSFTTSLLQRLAHCYSQEAQRTSRQLVFTEMCNLTPEVWPYKSLRSYLRRSRFFDTLWSQCCLPVETVGCFLISLCCHVHGSLRRVRKQHNTSKGG